MNAAFLKDVKVMIWLNDEVHTQPQREAFEQYMENGGAWLGFHVSAYNDRSSKWTWFRSFLGGGAFGMNNWPPLPATLVVDDPDSPVTRRVPHTFEAPANEWYSWTPSPRLNPDVKVLVSLDKSNFPIGLKDVIPPTDVPVVWTNTKYKMLYMNMGHGDKIFTSDIQQNMFEDGLLWLLQKQSQ
jgi:type 1 glutamine amidotransferase